MGPAAQLQHVTFRQVRTVDAAELKIPVKHNIQFLLEFSRSLVGKRTRNEDSKLLKFQLGSIGENVVDCLIQEFEYETVEIVR